MLIILIMVISSLVSSQLRSRLERYGQMALRSGFTGKEVAKKMLSDNGIYDVKVVPVLLLGGIILFANGIQAGRALPLLVINGT